MTKKKNRNKNKKKRTTTTAKRRRTRERKKNKTKVMVMMKMMMTMMMIMMMMSIYKAYVGMVSALNHILFREIPVDRKGMSRRQHAFRYTLLRTKILFAPQTAVHHSDGEYGSGGQGLECPVAVSGTNRLLLESYRCSRSSMFP